MKDANATPPTIGIREETTQMLGICMCTIMEKILRESSDFGDETDNYLIMLCNIHH